MVDVSIDLVQVFLSIRYALSFMNDRTSMSELCDTVTIVEGLIVSSMLQEFAKSFKIDVSMIRWRDRGPRTDRQR